MLGCGGFERDDVMKCRRNLHTRPTLALSSEQGIVNKAKKLFGTTNA
jgi:hypothetical protein